MQIHFLGGATTVTGSQFLLVTERARVLIDCGMFQGSPNESVRNRIPFAFDPGDLDAMLLTHAHLDHCGLIPLLVKAGFRGPIHATAGTIELATLVLLDSGKLHEEFAKREARWEKRHPDEVEADDRREADEYQAAVDLAAAGEGAATTGAVAAGGRRSRRSHRGRGAPPSTSRRPSKPCMSPATHRPPGRAIPRPTCAPSRRTSRSTSTPRSTRPRTPSASLAQFRPCTTTRRSRSRPGSTRPSSMPGTSSARRSSGSASRIRTVARSGSIVFSGDLGRPGTPILRDPTTLTDADYVLVESTYGGREHEPEAEAIRILAETVRMVADAGGVLLVPSFAIGRTQEVVWELDRLIERGEIPLLPLYLDSPMASKASDIYRRHPDYYDEETAKLLREGDTPLDYPNQIVTNDVKASQRDRTRAAAVHDRRLERDADRRSGRRATCATSSTIRPRRSCSSATRARERSGSHLQAGATEVKIDGQMRAVRCRTARSAASRRMPTRASCSTGSATSPPASSPATPAIRGGSSWSTATRRPRSRSSRRSGSLASRPTSRTGTSG